MMRRRCVCAWNANLTVSVVLVLMAMAVMTGCAGTPQPRPVTPPEAGDATSRGIPDESRGLHLAISPRLGFDHALHFLRSKGGVSHELKDGDTVMTGDRLRVSVQTSEDAHLYLAFCAHQELAVYPSQGGVRTRAGELMFAPPGNADLVFDGDPGTEVLYVILSRTELSLADSRLAQALAAQRTGSTPVDCGTSLEAKMAKLPSGLSPAPLSTPTPAPAPAPAPATPTPTPTPMPAPTPTPMPMKVVRGTVVPRKPLPLPHPRNGLGPPRAAISNAQASRTDSAGALHGPAFPDTPPALSPPPAPNPDAPPGPPPPDPDYERNPGNIVWYRVDGATGPADVVAADDDGIAVVRHTFTHVPQASPPSGPTASSPGGMP
jgi:hypothetical protein